LRFLNLTSVCPNGGENKKKVYKFPTVRPARRGKGGKKKKKPRCEKLGKRNEHKGKPEKGAGVLSGGKLGGGKKKGGRGLAVDVHPFYNTYQQSERREKKKPSFDYPSECDSKRKEKEKSEPQFHTCQEVRQNGQKDLKDNETHPFFLEKKEKNHSPRTHCEIHYYDLLGKRGPGGGTFFHRFTVKTGEGKEGKRRTTPVPVPTGRQKTLPFPRKEGGGKGEKAG